MTYSIMFLYEYILYIIFQYFDCNENGQITLLASPEIFLFPVLNAMVPYFPACFSPTPTFRMNKMNSKNED
ncbi:hypothetical protein QFZ51_000882 [Chitinophaga sp. W3I9]